MLIPLFFQHKPSQAEMFTAFVLTGISAGAISTLSADIRLILSYLYLLIVPMAIALLMQQSDIFLAMGIMGLVYVGMTTSTALEYHRTLRGSIARRLELKHAHEALVGKELETRRLFEHTPTGIFYYDRDMHLVDCNAAFCNTLETEKDRLIGLDMNTLPDQRILPTLQAALEDRPGHYQGHYHTLFSNKELWGDIHTTPIHDNQGRVIGAIGAIQDRSREHAALQEATQLALYDPLTQLPNRKFLTKHISQAIRRAHRGKQLSALLYLDLDDFKRVNDTYGHGEGDTLLIDFSRRSRGMLREDDTLSRLGGDEFVILASDLGDDAEAAMRHGMNVADKIHALCRRPFELGVHKLITTTSIGLVVIDGSLDTDELLRRADTAMYRAKD